MAHSETEHQTDRLKPGTGTVSLTSLLRRFRWRVLLTLSLVVVEAVVDLLFPLFIGIAINGLLAESYRGVIALGAVAVTALVIGSARRFYDTRAYAGIYEVTANELVDREREQGTSVSTITARSTLLREFVEFLENSMPAILTSLIGLVGVLVIVASINVDVFLACLGVLVIVVTQYWLTGNRNFRLNAGYNDELERQVDALSSQNAGRVRTHFHALMRWNIRLSDLETLNYAMVFVGVIALLVYSPIAVVDSTETEYGFVFSILMYVFQYVEILVALPYFIQQLIRLHEISGRLEADQVGTSQPQPE